LVVLLLVTPCSRRESRRSTRLLCGPWFPNRASSMITPGQAFWGLYSVMPVRPVPGLSADL
jgi:hypothetical protein